MGNWATEPPNLPTSSIQLCASERLWLLDPGRLEGLADTA